MEMTDEEHACAGGVRVLGTLSVLVLPQSFRPYLLYGAAINALPCAAVINVQGKIWFTTCPG